MPQSWEGQGEDERGGGCTGISKLPCLSSPFSRLSPWIAPFFALVCGGWDLRPFVFTQFPALPFSGSASSSDTWFPVPWHLLPWPPQGSNPSKSSSHSTTALPHTFFPPLDSRLQKTLSPPPLVVHGQLFPP